MTDTSILHYAAARVSLKQYCRARDITPCLRDQLLSIIDEEERARRPCPAFILIGAFEASIRVGDKVLVVRDDNVY